MYYLVKTGADLGFYKGGCTIHLKGAPVERPRGVRFGAQPQKIFVFFISKWCVFMHSRRYLVTVLFKKGTLIKRVGVRTPPGSAPAKINYLTLWLCP